MTKETFLSWTAQEVVLLDGATGSNLRAAGMPPGVSPELWVLEHPEILLELQRGFVEAGSQVLCAPTFSANRMSLRHFGLDAGMAGRTNRSLSGRRFCSICKP